MQVALVLSMHTIVRSSISLRSADHLSLPVIPAIGTDVAILLVNTDLDDTTNWIQTIVEWGALIDQPHSSIRAHWIIKGENRKQEKWARGCRGGRGGEGGIETWRSHSDTITCLPRMPNNNSCIKLELYRAHTPRAHCAIYRSAFVVVWLHQGLIDPISPCMVV